MAQAVPLTTDPIAFFMTRETVNQAISSLPQNFDLDALVERLIFIEKLEEGLAQLDRGECKTREEVKEIVKSWRK